MGEGSDLSIPKVMAVAAVAPIAILFLCLALRSGWQSLRVVTSWNRVEARVAEGSKDGTLTLEWPGEGGTVEVERAAGFGDLAAGTSVRVFRHPEQPSTIRRATFGELWLNAVFLGCFGLALAGIGAFMYQHRPDQDFEQARAQAEAAMARAKAAPAPRAPSAAADDGQPLVVTESSQVWHANLFWGLVLGLLMIGPAIFAPADAAPWKRWALLAAGVAWMTALGALALRNSGRTVELRGDRILVTSPFGARWISLDQVAGLERHDARQELRDLEAVGRSGRRNAPLDTRAAMIVYELKDARGWTLLRLHEDMRPPEVMDRLLARIEARLRER